jgi:hypothetical protein
VIRAGWSNRHVPRVSRKGVEGEMGLLQPPWLASDARPTAHKVLGCPTATAVGTDRRWLRKRAPDRSRQPAMTWTANSVKEVQLRTTDDI